MPKPSKPAAPPAKPRGAVKTTTPAGGMKTVLLHLPVKEPAETPGPARKKRRAT
jgi:hypothetical protein